MKTIIMDQRNRKQLIANIIKFVVGLILLGFAFGYLANHPAEKRSWNNGIQMIFRNIEVRINKLLGQYDEAEQYQQNLIAQYKEVAYIAETTSCFTPEMKQEFTENYESLQKASIDHFKQYQDNYYLIWTQYRAYIQRNCSTNSQE